MTYDEIARRLAVTFTNGDLDMVRLFLVFLGLLRVADDRVRLRPAIHHGCLVVGVLRGVVGVPPDHRHLGGGGGERL
jgi:hypothetical protein